MKTKMRKLKQIAVATKTFVRLQDDISGKSHNTRKKVHQDPKTDRILTSLCELEPTFESAEVSNINGLLQPEQIYFI